MRAVNDAPDASPRMGVGEEGKKDLGAEAG